MEPGDAGDYVRRHVLQQIGMRQSSARQHSTAAGPHTLQLPLRGLLLSTYTTHSGLHADVAHHVTFASRLQTLAGKAVSILLERSGAAAFNGVHLRIEGDSPNVDFMHGALAPTIASSEKRQVKAMERVSRIVGSSDKSYVCSFPHALSLQYGMDTKL